MYNFHCKAGFGRTTTYMIMYDMTKNYKEVSAEEIIKRQLGLANFNENTIQSFYNNERISFLNKFYEYCKTNGDSLKIKWSEWKKTSSVTSSISFNVAQISNVNSTFMKNTIIPKHLYVISLDSMSASERTMAVSIFI